MSKTAKSGNVHWDHRDQEVLAVVEAADRDEWHAKHLREIYEKRTDVRRRETLTGRLEKLTKYGPFEQVAFQRWRQTDN